MPTELDPEDFAETRPNLRDSLLFVKIRVASAHVRNLTNQHKETDVWLPIDLLDDLILEVESLWRDLIDSDKALTSAVFDAR